MIDSILTSHFSPITMNNAILSCLSSYSYTNNGCNEVLAETPSPISSNLIFNDNSLCFYGDFSSGHSRLDPQNTLNTQSSCSILVSGSTSTSQGETQLNYMPVQEDIFHQPWTNTYVQQSKNEIQLIQNARKRSAEAGPCSLINSETNERDREKTRSTRFQGKLLKIPKEKDPTVRRRSQKLTDKITTLQKLVSPYGKVATEKQPIIAILHNTDTASVLLEASVSIKALQDQIEEMFRMTSGEQMTNMTGEKRSDLQCKGLCLVPSVILEELDRRLPIHCLQRETLLAVNIFAENL